ncbi:MAG: hypothetical protein U0414_23930 [Polyangiaceae bacterium]
MVNGRALTVVFEDAATSMVFAENLALVVWRNAPTSDHVRRWHRFALDHARGPHAPGACVDIIVNGTPSFTDEMRQETNRFAGDPKVFPRGMSHVVLMGGLAGSAVRAFIGTVMLLVKPPAPAKVFGDFDAASRWMQPLLGPSWSVAEIRNLSVEVANRVPVLR